MKFILVRLKSNSVRNNNVYWKTAKIIFEEFQHGTQATANSKDSNDSVAAWVKTNVHVPLVEVQVLFGYGNDAFHATANMRVENPKLCKLKM